MDAEIIALLTPLSEKKTIHKIFTLNRHLEFNTHPNFKKKVKTVIVTNSTYIKKMSNYLSPLIIVTSNHCHL
jgi:hypothetical protein